MVAQGKQVLYGLYTDEEVLKSAVAAAKTAHLDIDEVYSPFPIHGLDPILGLKESRLHYLGFIYGSIGALFGFLFMTWAFTSDWPMIIGGKPYWSVPAFIPITFELTVLFSAWGMTLTFYTICGMWPGVEAKLLDNRTTDNLFALSFDTTTASEDDVNRLRSFFGDTGAAEINAKTI